MGESEYLEASLYPELITWRGPEVLCRCFTEKKAALDPWWVELVDVFY